MAWLPNIPQPSQSKSSSQPQILGNFQALNTYLNINHVDFGGADQGKHKFISFPVQGSDPVTAANEVALFAKTSTLSSIPELFIRKSSAGATYEFSSCLAAQPGWTRLPSGILLKWGSGTANGYTSFVFPVAGNIPAFTQIFSMALDTAYNLTTDGNGFVREAGVRSITGFNAYGSFRTQVADMSVAFTYLAIGI